LKLDGFSEVVQSAWGEIDGDPDPFPRLTAKLKRTVRSLMSYELEQQEDMVYQTAADDSAGGSVKAGHCHGIMTALPR
jgi:hypothetical protein